MNTAFFLLLITATVVVRAVALALPSCAGHRVALQPVVRN
jgi:hypothetical protein